MLGRHRRVQQRQRQQRQRQQQQKQLQQQQQHRQLSSNTTAVEHRPHYLSGSQPKAITVVPREGEECPGEWQWWRRVADGGHAHDTFCSLLQLQVDPPSQATPQSLSATPHPTRVHRCHGELARVYACRMPSLDGTADSCRVCWPP